MNVKRSFLFTLLCISTGHIAFAQDYYINDTSSYLKKHISTSIGAAINVSMFQLAPDLRLYLPITNKIQLMSGFSSYGFASKSDAYDSLYVHEYYINTDLKYDFTIYKHLSGYITSGFVFADWLNYDAVTGAQKFYGADGGVGIQYEFAPLTFFFEQKTNSIFWEYITTWGLKINLVNFNSHHKQKTKVYF